MKTGRSLDAEDDIYASLKILRQILLSEMIGSSIPPEA